MSKNTNLDLIFKALNFAARAHEGQKRKDKTDLAYIVHPTGVALLLMRVGADEAVIAAGLLHDVVEDCNVTLKELEKEFGREVATMVADVTEPGSSYSWEERKQHQIDYVKKMSRGSMMVKAADIIHNRWSLVSALEIEGPSILKNFHSPFSDYLKIDRKRYEELKNKWPTNPLLPELNQGIKQFEQALKLWSTKI